MKKLFAFLLVLSLVCCACAALADTDKEIQFADHTFGETLDQAMTVASLRYITLSASPYTSRIIADPFCNWYGQVIYGRGNVVTFQTEWEMKENLFVAGHEAYADLYFYYPTAEDAAALNLKNGIFYAGSYGFYDNDNSEAIYADLKAKLTTLYGEPFAEDENNGDGIFGGPITTADGREETLNDFMENANGNFSSVTMTAWKSSANNAMVVLAYYDQNGWKNARLHYIDLGADEKILAIFQPETANTDGASADDMGGL